MITNGKWIADQATHFIWFYFKFYSPLHRLTIKVTHSHAHDFRKIPRCIRP